MSKISGEAKRSTFAPRSIAAAAGAVVAVELLTGCMTEGPTESEGTEVTEVCYEIEGVVSVELTDEEAKGIAEAPPATVPTHIVDTLTKQGTFQPDLLVMLVTPGESPLAPDYIAGQKATEVIARAADISSEAPLISVEDPARQQGTIEIVASTQQEVPCGPSDLMPA